MAREGAAPGPESPDGASLHLGHLGARPEDHPARGRWAVAGTVAALVVLAGLLVLRALDVEPIARLRLVGFDTMQRLLPADRAAGAPVTVVAIDEASLGAYGQWPWPRDLMAQVVDAVDAAGARLIAFDIVFAEPDRLNPDALVARLGLPPAEAEALRATAIAPDAALVEAVSAAVAPVVLANALDADGASLAAQASVILPPTLGVDGAADWGRLTTAERVIGNIPQLEAAADGRGFLTIFNDGDGVVRRLPTLAHAGSSLQTGLALEVTRIALGAEAAVAASHARFGITAIRVGERMIPTDPSGAVWLSAPAGPIDRVSIVDLLNGRVDPEALSGQIVLIGSTALGLGDLATTGDGATRPGVEVLAHGIRDMLAGRPLHRPGWTGWLELFVALLVGLVFVYRMSLYSAVRTAVWGSVAVLAIIAACAASRTVAGLLIDPTFPGLVAALFAAAAGYGRSRQIEHARQLARQQLDDADRLIGRLVDATFDAIVVIDRSGRLVFANRAATVLPIFAGGLATGTDLRPVLRPADAGRAARGSLLEELAAQRGIVDLVTTSSDGGAPIYLEVTATALEEDGATALVMRDVTARRAARRRIEAQAAELTQMTEDLRQQSAEAQAARQAAESANAAKGEFLMMMSHELRTPLNAVIGFAEMIAQEPFGPLGDARYGDYLGDIRSSGVQLLGMIDMILEVIRLDNRDVATHDVAFDVTEVVAECCTAIRPEAEAKSIRLELAATAGLPHFLGDTRLMRQVLVCLLSNAIKFTEPEGHVAVAVDAAPDDGLLISVTDDGIGMTETELERAEILLQQGGGGIVRRHGGVGIGLTLAKLATEKQGGRMELDSVVGRGTVVRVVFPPSRLNKSAGGAEVAEGGAAADKGETDAGDTADDTPAQGEASRTAS